MIPALLGIIIVGFIKATYSFYFNLFIQGVFFRFPIDRMLREGSVPVRRVSFFLDLVYFAVFPAWVVSAAYHLELLPGIGISSYLLALLVLGALLVLRGLRFAFNRLIGYITLNHNALSAIHFHQLVYPRVMAVLLPLTLFIFHYSRPPLQDVTLYATLSILFILFIIRLFRTFLVFLAQGFSLFYFLLYLCALELSPFLALLRDVLWRGSESQ